MADFNSKNEGTWFNFDDTSPEAGGVCLRELSAEESKRIEKITVKHRRKPIRGVLVDVPEEDSELSTKLTWDYCIKDWKNVKLDGQNMECDRINKEKMMKSTDFAKFIGDCITELVDINKTIEEARVKNLKSSSSGNLKNPSVTPV